jgi:hypothetical protein
MASRLDLRGHQPRLPAVPDDGHHGAPNEVGYLELSSEIRAEFVLAWRKNGTPSLTYPPDGQVTNPTLDIRGEPVDQAGNPISVQRNIQELTITENVEVSGVVDLSILPIC